MPDGASPRPPLAQRNSVASRNSMLPYFEALVPGGASHPPIPCAARFRRHSIFAAPKLQDCSVRRHLSSPIPDAAQFRRQSKFAAPILQDCSARRRQPSPTPGAAQFRRQSKCASPKLQDCSARRRQPSPTPGAAHFRRQSKFEALKLQDSGGMWSLRDVHVLRNCVNAHMRQQHCSSSSDLFSIVKP